jgi:hypothetical protein
MLYLCLDIYARYFTNFYYPTFYIFVDVSDKLLKRRKCNSNGKNNVLYKSYIFCNWPPWYNWNIDESGVNHHNSNSPAIDKCPNDGVCHT